jgi:hypothetical protein
MSEENTQNNNEETKENFCGACLAVPLALMGAGAAGVGAKKSGSNTRMKKILLWGGISLTLISVIIAIIYILKCKDCR